jgi:hypothetical protein
MNCVGLPALRKIFRHHCAADAPCGISQQACQIAIDILFALLFMLLQFASAILQSVSATRACVLDPLRHLRGAWFRVHARKRGAPGSLLVQTAETRCKPGLANTDSCI